MKLITAQQALKLSSNKQLGQYPLLLKTVTKRIDDSVTNGETDVTVIFKEKISYLASLKLVEKLRGLNYSVKVDRMHSTISIDWSKAI